MDEQNDGIVRVTKDDIGVMAEVGFPSCAWCADGGQDWALGNGEGERICDECAALAREVGDGTLAILTCGEHPESSRRVAVRGPYYRYRLHTALQLTVWVEHLRPDARADGVPWLCGVPATANDRRTAKDLGLFVQATCGDDRLGVMGVNREDLLQNMAAHITTHLECRREDVEHCAQDARPHYQEMLEVMERHIAEVERI